MNWFDRIIRAIRLGHFANKEVVLAWGWNTCAVGEVLESYGLPVEQRPYKHSRWCWLVENIDPKLDRLGITFHNAVQTHNVAKALQIYTEIQEYKPQ